MGYGKSEDLDVSGHSDQESTRVFGGNLTTISRDNISTSLVRGARQAAARSACDYIDARASQLYHLLFCPVGLRRAVSSLDASTRNTSMKLFEPGWTLCMPDRRSVPMH